MQQRQYTLAVDVGTTAVKVIAYDLDGEVFARSARQLDLYHDDTGAAEQDARAVYDAATAALTGVARQVRDAGHTVARVGFSAAMHSLLPVAADGSPLMRAMTWGDVRAQRQAARLWQSPEGRAIYARTGTPVHAMAPLAKVIWLRETHPELFAQAARFVSLKEWMWHRWFGEWQVDASIASATGFYNLHDHVWDEGALRAAGIDAARLAQVVPTTYCRSGHAEAALTMAGIGADVPFNIGASDGVLANLGVGAVADDVMVLTIGTSLAVRVGSTVPVTDGDTRSFCYVLADGRYILGGPSNNGGIVLDWLYHNILSRRVVPDPKPITSTPDADFTATINAAEVADAKDLLFLPYVAGERAPLWNGDASGVLFGLTVRHTNADVMRAAIEGVLLNAYWIASRIFERVGQPRAIIASGGTLEEGWIRALTADIFGMPVMQIGTIDASAAGAAALANIATGAWTWDGALRIHSGSPTTTLAPSGAGKYAAKFARFRRLAEALSTDLADIYYDQPQQ